MRYLTTAVLLMLLLLVQAAPGAGEKKASKKQLDGTWKHTAGENSVLFKFKGNTLHAVVKTTERTLDVDADYGVSKDGVLFGRISKVKSEGEGPSEGDLFSFRFRIDGNSLTVSDLKTPHDNPEAKELLQGEYHKQKEKAK